MNEVKIQWHSGFVAAMDLELSANRNDLIYEREYNLNTKPLEIDLLVIKKDKDVQIANEIGKIFRKFNILEYKSPGEHLNADTFYKSEAYASLYKAYGETADERKAEDITVSIVRDTKPKGLFQYFAEHGIRTERPYKGIYYVLDQVLFPTQIIVSKELEEESHRWLKALSDKLKKQQLKALLEQIEGLTKEQERALADAVLEVSVRANQKIVEELRGDESMCQALLEIMEPEISKIVGEATEKVRKETEKVVKEEDIKTAIKMLKSGKFSIEEIKEYVPRLSIDEIRSLEKEQIGA